jgi:3D (Asp-Asp-Asp) domain-containing protein
VAVSRDLMGYLGRRVYVKGMGVFRVEDLMAERFEKSIDFFFDNKEEALKFGKKKVEVVFLN